MDSFDGGNWLATGMQLCDIVLYNSFNGRVKVKGSAEWCQILQVSGSSDASSHQ